MTTRVLIVGHADADGHIITEQVRRNLALVDSFDVKVVVDPVRTKDHKAWTHLDAIDEITQADYVFFVDLMFGPATYADEARALTSFARAHPEKRFFVIDHHPLPLRRLEEAENLRTVYRPDVSECAIGPRSGMMVVAALCERQLSEVADVKIPMHEALAIGMRRAAALGGPLSGKKLSALLEADQWDGLLQLGQEDAQHHYLPRGRRPRDRPLSETMKNLDQSASHLLSRARADTRAETHRQVGRTSMAYDLDVGRQQLSYDSGRRILLTNVSPSSKDLGVIVTLLEIAALSLTPEPGATFTLDQLIREAREVSGNDVDLAEGDVRIVLKKVSFLEQVGREFRLRQG